MCGQCVGIRPFYNMNKRGKFWNLEYSRQVHITKQKRVLGSTLVCATMLVDHPDMYAMQPDNHELCAVMITLVIGMEKITTLNEMKQALSTSAS